MEKIAISLDEKLLSQIEALRTRTGEARSALIRRALELLLDRERKQQQIESYVSAYTLEPESDPEVAAAFAETKATWSTLDGEDDW